jgi:hypothetical protein
LFRIVIHSYISCLSIVLHRQAIASDRQCTPNSSSTQAQCSALGYRIHRARPLQIALDRYPAKYHIHSRGRPPLTICCACFGRSPYTAISTFSLPAGSRLAASLRHCLRASKNEQQLYTKTRTDSAAPFDTLILRDAHLCAFDRLDRTSQLGRF